MRYCYHNRVSCFFLLSQLSPQAYTYQLESAYQSFWQGRGSGSMAMRQGVTESETSDFDMFSYKDISSVARPQSIWLAKVKILNGLEAVWQGGLKSIRIPISKWSNTLYYNMNEHLVLCTLYFRRKALEHLLAMN